MAAAFSLMLTAILAVLWQRERRRRMALQRSRRAPAEQPDVVARLSDDEQLALGIFASSPDAILVLDPSNENEPMAIIVCSENVCAWHGWRRDELIGRSVNQLEANPMRWTAATSAEHVARLREARLVRGEAEHRRRDGSIFPIEFTNSLLVLGGREYVLGFDRDITARREVEAALRASEQRFRAIIDASPVAIWLIDPHDPKVPRRIVEANEYAAKMHGVNLADMIGRSLNEFDVTYVSYEEDQVRLEQARNKQGLNHGQGMHRRSDGTVFPIQYVGTLLKIAGRELILGIDQDITERKQAEAALRASEERFRAIFNASPAGMQLQDPHDREVPLRIVDANQHAAEIHGLKVEDMIGRSIGDFDTGAVTYELAQARLERLRSSRSSHGEAVHRRADGHEFPIEYVSTLLVLDGRELILGIDRDITERKRIDTELNESRRLRAVGAMVGGIAHEFNNLLTPMLLHVDLLLSPTVNASVAQAAARPLRQAITQASELTRRILTFGRRDDAQRDLCDLSEVVRDAVNLLGQTIDRRIRLTVQGVSMARVRARRTDLSQIVINLLLNARDTVLERSARVEGGTCWIPVIEIETGPVEPDRGHRAALGARPPSGWVRLRVKDNGMGMDETVRERLFEPFFTTKQVGRGTGLGLATVWHLVRAEDGHIIIDSRSGEGTTMNVYLPAAAATEASKNAEAVAMLPAPIPAPKRGGPRVLLVEDQELVGGSVEGLLIHYGHDVRWISDGAEAWTWIGGHLDGFDILITDLNLPGLSGLELVERVRGAGFEGKIIAYSGMIIPEVESRLRRAGIHGLLAKPFQINELMELLRP